MRSNHLAIALVICAGMSVAQNNKPSIPATAHEGNPDPCSQTNAFFPPAEEKWFGSGFSYGADQALWEGQYLHYMHEPSLYACSQTESTYRFLWDRSLSQPVVTRLVVHDDGSGTLYVRMLANAGLRTPEPGKKLIPLDEWFRVTFDRQVPVTPEQVTHVQALFAQIDFAYPHSNDTTTDGSDWIFESKLKGRYRLVDFRNKPPAQIRELGLYLVLELARLPIPSEAIY